MFAPIVGGGYALFSLKDFFSWKQKVIKKTPHRYSRTDLANRYTMPEASDLDTDSVVRPKEGLPPAEKLSFLEMWRTSYWNFNIGRFTMIMFEETYITLIFGLMAIMLEHLVQPIMKEFAGSPWLIGIPLSFFLILCISRPFETHLLKIVYLIGKSHGCPEKRDGTTIRFQRILQNVLLLVLIIGMQVTPSALINTLSDAEIDAVLKKNLEWTPYHYLLLVLNLARKFHGACAMVVVYRIYIDLALQTSSYVTGYPSLFPEPEKVKQQPRDNNDIINGNIEDANANFVSGVQFGGSYNDSASARASRRVFYQPEN